MSSHLTFWIVVFVLIFHPSAFAQDSKKDQVDALMERAKAQSKEGNPKDALASIKKGLALLKQEGGPEVMQTAIMLNRAGLYASDIGDPISAVGFFNDSLRVLRNLGEENGELASYVYGNLAVEANYRGAYSVSIGHLRQSLAIKKKLLGNENAETVATMLKLAHELNSVGQSQEAGEIETAALLTQIKLHGAESLQAAEIMSEICAISNNVGKYELAQESGERALKIQKKNLPEDHETMGATNEALGITFSRLGKFDQATKHLKKALAIYKKSRDTDHPQIADVLIHLGQVYRLQGNAKLARETFRESQKKMRQFHGPMHHFAAVPLYGIAETSFLMNDFPTALSACDEARRITKNHFAKVLPYLPESEQLSFIDDEDSARFEEIISASLLLKDNDQSAELSASWALNQKGVAQEALAVQNRVIGAINDPKQKEKIVELNEARQQIAQLSLLKPEDVDKKKLAGQREVLNRKVDLLTNQLSIANATADDFDAWIELNDVRESLDKETYVVEFVRYDQYSFGENPPWGAAKYAAWVIPPAGIDKVRLIDLGLAEPIDQMILALRKEIANAGAKGGTIQVDGEEKGTAKIQPRLKGLYDKIFRPFASHVRSAKKLVLSPDGSLWLAPWAALPYGEPGSFLIEKMSLSFVVSPSGLVNGIEKEIVHTAPIVVANPRFDLTPDSVWKSIREVLRSNSPADEDRQRGFKSVGGRGFTNVLPLPNTAIEAEFIAPSLVAYANEKPIRYMEQYALETIVKKIYSPSVLFFGTHGFFLEDSKSKGSENGNKAGDEMRNPLSRCGLLLAGCKDPKAGTGTAGDDGVLTGLEIVGLNLQGTELVILSACETAVGSTRNGEGVSSLSQAFHLAGAKSVVATLWSVSDRESALLITKFMEEVAKGKSKAAAMQAAQIERIQKHRERFGAAHPYFWASHTVNGK